MIMDVVRLDPTTFRPDTMVEGYSSMIWTERYIENGEFEMKTPKISDTRTLLPEGSLISLRDSDEVMLVEAHTLGRDSDNMPEMTLTGRTFPTFFENRALLPTIYNEKWSVYRQYTPSEMIALLMWMFAINTNGEDPTRVATTMDSYLYILNAIVTDSTSATQSSISWTLETKTVYDTLHDFLVLANFGIRTIRPKNTSGNVMTFDTTRTTSRGTPTKTLSSTISDKLRFDVYHGLDRTRNQTDRTPIIFHYDSGHIDDPSYLFSIKDLKHAAAVHSSLGNTLVWPDTTPPPSTTVTGLNRRLLLVDGGTQGSMSEAEFTAAITQKARIELMKHNRAVIFDGAISPLSPYKYNSHYFLGDKVTLLAEYGYEAQMMVNEYVRTEDIEGDRGYPGLILAT